MGTKQNVYGEGNYEATRQYNDATKKFIDAGKVDGAARKASPASREEANEMKDAEQAALLRSKVPPASESMPDRTEPAPPAPPAGHKKSR